ncbi:MAG: glycosyltransferase family 4 protein [Moheibacter sp.]
MKPKILFIGSFILPKNGHYGGVYFASTTLRDGLKKEGYEIVEMDTTLKDMSETRVYKRIPDILIRQIKFIYKIIRNPRSKYLFVFLSGGGSYIDKFLPILFAKLLFMKVVLFPRSGHLIRDMGKLGFKCFILAGLRMSDKIICQSEFWKEYFYQQKVNENKLSVIENWVADHMIQTSTHLNFHSSYTDINQHPFKIVFVSRIEKAKGVDDIIELAKNLKNKLNISIDVYGSGGYERTFKNKIRQNDIEKELSFKGWLKKEEMLQTINSYNLAIFTSVTEGYPNALLDYIFSKIPVISTNLPMVTAVGKHNILYYEVNNTADLELKTLFAVSNYNLMVQKAEILYQEKKDNNNLATALSKLKASIGE